jgi:hypothetical protein
MTLQGHCHLCRCVPASAVHVDHRLLESEYSLRGLISLRAFALLSCHWWMKFHLSARPYHTFAGCHFLISSFSPESLVFATTTTAFCSRPFPSYRRTSLAVASIEKPQSTQTTNDDDGDANKQYPGNNLKDGTNKSSRSKKKNKKPFGSSREVFSRSSTLSKRTTYTQDQNGNYDYLLQTEDYSILNYRCKPYVLPSSGMHQMVLDQVSAAAQGASIGEEHLEPHLLDGRVPLSDDLTDRAENIQVRACKSGRGDALLLVPSTSSHALTSRCRLGKI